MNEQKKKELTQKMIGWARQFLKERRKYSVEILPNSMGTGRLEQRFMIDDEETLKKATEAVCKAEDVLIRSKPDVVKIGIITDMQLSFIDDKYGVVWERITPITKADVLLRQGVS